MLQVSTAVAVYANDIEVYVDIVVFRDGTDRYSCCSRFIHCEITSQTLHFDFITHYISLYHEHFEHGEHLTKKISAIRFPFLILYHSISFLDHSIPLFFPIIPVQVYLSCSCSYAYAFHPVVEIKKKTDILKFASITHLTQFSNIFTN